MLFDRGHPCFWNFNAIIPVDVIRVKSYVNGLFNPTGVPEHSNATGHYPLWDEVKFIDRDPHWYTRRCTINSAILSEDIRSSLKAIKIVPNVFSDHAALSLVLTHCEKEANRGPGFWKFNNSLLIDKEYLDLITAKIPEFVLKYHDIDVTDKGLLWELIKMEIRAATIAFSKSKALQQRDEEKVNTNIQ